MLEDILNDLITNYKYGYSYISNTRKLLEYLNSHDTSNIHVYGNPNIYDGVKKIMNKTNNDDDYKNYVKFYMEIGKLLN